MYTLTFRWPTNHFLLNRNLILLNPDSSISILHLQPTLSQRFVMTATQSYRSLMRRRTSKRCLNCRRHFLQSRCRLTTVTHRRFRDSNLSCRTERKLAAVISSLYRLLRRRRRRRRWREFRRGYSLIKPRQLRRWRVMSWLRRAAHFQRPNQRAWHDRCVPFARTRRPGGQETRPSPGNRLEQVEAGPPVNRVSHLAVRIKTVSYTHLTLPTNREV